MSRKIQYTIKDLAKKLGIHHTTVSRALRDHPDVSSETKRRVLEVAESLNYIPNLYATNLRNSKSQTIVVIVPEIKHHFFASVIGNISSLAFKNGYSLLVYQSLENSGLESQILKSVLKNRVAGIIVSLANTGLNMEEFLRMEEFDIPVVFFDRVFNHPDFTEIRINNYKAGFDAVRILVKSGKKRIGFYNRRPSNYTFDERFRGYLDALRKYEISFKEERVFHGGDKAEDGSKLAHQILDSGLKIDSIICCTDSVALGFISYTKELMINIPEEMAVIGFDNHPAGRFIYPGLTSFENPVSELGISCFKKLQDKIRKDKSYRNEIILDMKLIKRKSV